jgi:hypothetical protein
MTVPERLSESMARPSNTCTHGAGRRGGGAAVSTHAARCVHARPNGVLRACCPAAAWGCGGSCCPPAGHLQATSAVLCGAEPACAAPRAAQGPVQHAFGLAAGPRCRWLLPPWPAPAARLIRPTRAHARTHTRTWLLTMSGCGACWYRAASSRRLRSFMPCNRCQHHTRQARARGVRAAPAMRAAARRPRFAPACVCARRAPRTAPRPTCGRVSAAAAAEMWLIPTCTGQGRRAVRSVRGIRARALLSAASCMLLLLQRAAALPAARADRARPAPDSRCRSPRRRL